MSACLDVTDLRDAGLECGRLRDRFTVQQLKEGGFTIAQLRDGGFTVAQLKQADFAASQLREVGFTAAQLRKGGFTADQLTEIGFTAVQLREAGFQATHLKDAGSTADELKLAGFSAAQLKGAGYSAADVYPLCRRFSSRAELTEGQAVLTTAGFGQLAPQLFPWARTASPRNRDCRWQAQGAWEDYWDSSDVLRAARCLGW